nr:MAG TPA: hypothetical protein [Caudoviricetes sp.]
MNTRSVLEDEIERISAKLNVMEPGTDEYEKLSNLLHKYIDRRTELEKADYDADEKALAREESNELKTQQLNEAKKDRIAKVVMWAVGGISGGVVSIWAALKAFKFDGDGRIFSSTFGRDSVKNLIRFKK